MSPSSSDRGGKKKSSRKKAAKGPAPRKKVARRAGASQPASQRASRARPARPTVESLLAGAGRADLVGLYRFWSGDTRASFAGAFRR